MILAAIWFFIGAAGSAILGVLAYRAIERLGWGLGNSTLNELDIILLKQERSIYCMLFVASLFFMLAGAWSLSAYAGSVPIDSNMRRVPILMFLFLGETCLPVLGIVMLYRTKQARRAARKMKIR